MVAIKIYILWILSLIFLLKYSYCILIFWALKIEYANINSINIKTDLKAHLHGHYEIFSEYHNANRKLNNHDIVKFPMKLKTKLTTKPHKEKVLKFDWKIPKNLLNDLKFLKTKI